MLATGSWNEWSQNCRSRCCCGCAAANEDEPNHNSRTQTRSKGRADLFRFVVGRNSAEKHLLRSVGDCQRHPELPCTLSEKEKMRRREAQGHSLRFALSSNKQKHVSLSIATLLLVCCTPHSHRSLFPSPQRLLLAPRALLPLRLIARRCRSRCR